MDDREVVRQYAEIPEAEHRSLEILGLLTVDAYALALALIKSQSQRMNRRKKAEGLNDADDELEQFYTLNCATFNKKITSSKLIYNGN